MRTYIKPTAEKVTFTYENQVVAASDCYTTSAYIHQRPETGRGDYRIQVNAAHQADHTNNAQVFTIIFNQPVNYVSCNGQGASLQSGDGTNTLKISLTYTQNQTDNIGFGDLVVNSDSGLSIVAVSMAD